MRCRKKTKNASCHGNLRGNAFGGKHASKQKAEGNAPHQGHGKLCGKSGKPRRAFAEQGAHFGEQKEEEGRLHQGQSIANGAVQGEGEIKIALEQCAVGGKAGHNAADDVSTSPSRGGKCPEDKEQRNAGERYELAEDGEIPRLRPNGLPQADGKEHRRTGRHAKGGGGEAKRPRSTRSALRKSANSTL